MFFILGWGWGLGRGGGDNVHVNFNTHPLYGVHKATHASLSFGLGWGGVGTTAFPRSSVRLSLCFLFFLPDHSWLKSNIESVDARSHVGAYANM